MDQAKGRVMWNFERLRAMMSDGGDGALIEGGAYRVAVVF
jgi:hypothetical protein